MGSVQKAFLDGESNASDMCGKLVGQNTREYGVFEAGEIFILISIEKVTNKNQVLSAIKVTR